MRVLTAPLRTLAQVFFAVCIASECSGQQSADNPPDLPANSAAAAVDIYGDPLPTGAVARLGTVRFRTGTGLHGAFHSANGKWLIGVSENEICYWNADDGRLGAKIPIEKQHVQQVAVSDDRRWCCTAGFFRSEEHTQHSYTLKVWNLETRQQKRVIEVDRENQPSHLAMTSDGALIAAGTGRGRVSIYEAASGAELLSASILQGDVWAIAFSPSDRRIIAGAYNAPLQMWDWENGVEPTPVPEVTGRFDAMAFSADGTYLAIGMNGPDGLQVRRTADWSRLDTIRTSGNYRHVRGVAFSPDGRSLASADYVREAVTLRDFATGKVIHEWPVRPEHARHLAFSPDGEWLVAASDFTPAPPRIWNTRTGQPLELTAVGHREAPARIEFGPGGQTLVTAGDDGTVRFWDAATGRQVRMASHHPTEQPNRQFNVWIRALALSDDGRFFATSSLDESVCLWDAATTRLIYRLPGHGRLGGRRALEFSPDGSRLASWGDDMYLRVWDTKTGKATAEHAIRPGGVEFPTNEDGVGRFGSPFEDLSMRLGEAVFSSDASRMLLTMGSKMYVFDVETGRELSAIEQNETGFLMGLAISPNRELIAASTMGRPVQRRLPGGGTHFSNERSQIVQIWRLDDGELRHKLVVPGGSGGPVAFSPDGKLLAAGTRNAGGPIRILAIETGEPVAEISGFDSELHALAFSDDGRLLASSLSNTTVLVWDWPQFQKK
jgi:WD40 repeat protein